MRRFKWASLFFVLPAGLLAQPFFFRRDIPVGGEPRTVLPGDFDGDGRLDLAIITAEGMSVLLNKGAGNFASPILTKGSFNLFWLGVAQDFNGDGKDDLIGSGYLYLSRGDGRFLSPRYIGAQEAVAAGDFNRDGKMDLLNADFYWRAYELITHGVRVFQGDGDGGFVAGASVTARAAVQVRLADFNRDGRMDVAVLPMPTYPDLTSGDTTTLLVFPGQGDGTFGPEIRTPVRGASSFQVADFNGDGLPDIFTATGIMLGKGDGSFQSPVAFSPGTCGSTIAIADFTGDRYADLVVAPGTHSIATCIGKGDGTFLPLSEQAFGRLPHPGWARSAAAMDLDGDGRLDLVTMNAGGSDTVPILLGRAQGGPSLRRAVSAASGTAIVAPESLATLYGPTAATATSAALPPWPNRLGGIGLDVRDSAGVSSPAPLVSVSTTQIAFRVPAGTALGEAALFVGTDSGTTEAGGMQVNAIAPALFAAFSETAVPVPAATAVLVNADGTQVPLPVFACSTSRCALQPVPLSTAGGRPVYVSVFGTGFRGANADNVVPTANGVPLPVVYAGPQQTPGVDQINMQLLPKVLDTITCEPLWGCEYASVSIAFGGAPAVSFWLSVE